MFQNKVLLINFLINIIHIVDWLDEKLNITSNDFSLICKLIAIIEFQKTVYAEKEIDEEPEEWIEAEYQEEKDKNLKDNN